MNDQEVIDLAQKLKLTEKQRRFGMAFVTSGGNQTEAARKAGYSGSEAALASRGWEVVRNKKVAQFIKELQKDGVKDELDTLDGRRRAWKELYRDSEEPRDKATALRELGRTYGDFIDRTKEEGEKTIRLVVEEEEAPHHPDNAPQSKTGEKCGKRKVAKKTTKGRK